MVKDKFSCDVKQPMQTGMLMDMTVDMSLTPGLVLPAGQTNELKNAMPGVKANQSVIRPSLKEIMKDFSDKTKAGLGLESTPIFESGHVNQVPQETKQRRTQKTETVIQRQTELDIVAEQEAKKELAADTLQGRSKVTSESTGYKSVGAFLAATSGKEQHFLMNREDRVALAASRLGFTDEEEAEYE